MNSNALFRLQSEYESDSDSEDVKPEAVKPEAVTDQGPDLNHDMKPMVEIESNVDTDVKPNLVNLQIDLKPMPMTVPDVNNVPNMDHNMRDIADSSNEIDISSDSSSSSWSLSSDDEFHEEELNERKTTKCKIIKTKGELSLDDLPPIEKLSISVGVEELSQLGRVSSIVDQLVIVQSFRSMPALDLDSVLFFKDGQPLGRIFDVFGPVVEPRYAVRFNDVQEINELKICADTPIYFAAEQKQPITGFIFAEQLRRMKGSDASWKHNNEPPEDMVEYSDDESERIQKHRSNPKRSYSQRNCKLKQNVFSFVSK